MEKLGRLCLGGAALLLMAGLLAPQSAQATHFRGMYVYVSDTGPGGEVEITVVQFWRYSVLGNDFDNNDPDEPGVGGTVDPTVSALGFAGAVDLGDGTTYGDEASETWTVSALNKPQDWVVLRATFTHTYDTEGEKTLTLDGCCRISDLVNKNNEGYKVEATINTENLSATTSSGPFVGVEQGSNVTYQVPSTNPDNDQLRFRLASPSEMGASSSNPPNLSIDEDTGKITWDNSGLSQGSLWAVQVIIEEYGPNDDPEEDEPKATVPSDFMFKIAGAENDPPVCTLDPSSPTVQVGDPVSIDVTGKDPTGDLDDEGSDNTVSISALSLPGGSLNPNPAQGISPQTATFTWTPSSPGTFNALFSISDGLISTQCTATIDVVESTCDTPTLGPEEIDRSANTVSNTITDNEGIQVFEFTVLKNFTVASISPSVGYNRVPNTNAYRWVGSGPPPTKVDFTLQAGASGQGTYFLEAGDACPDGTKTLVADPVYDLGPSERQFRLAGPNPFSNQTAIEIGVPEQMNVSLSVYNTMGQKVATLVDDTKTTGMHTVRWDGQSGSGKALASGLYLLRLEADDWTATRRVTIVR